MSSYRLVFAGLLFIVAGVMSIGAIQAQDGSRHSEYYYPEPATFEVYNARVPVLPGSDRLRRIGFVTVMTNEMFKNTRITSCSKVLQKNGQAVCMAFKNGA